MLKYFFEPTVERCSGRAKEVVLTDVFDQSDQLMHSLTCESRGEEDRRISCEGELTINLITIDINGLVIFFDRVPLVDQDDECSSLIMGEPDDLSVLVRDSLYCIDEDHRDMTSLDRADGAHHAETFTALASNIALAS